MIAKITRGQRVHGLIYYLFGPGRTGEHQAPRVVGAWDGHVERYQAMGRADLARLLSQPIQLGSPGRKNPVWHASVRNHVDDRALSDEEWSQVAAGVVAEAGLAGGPVDSGTARR